MSTLKTNNIANVAGTSTTDVLNVINGSAKAWVNFNGTGTVAIRAGYNVSSITDNGTGDYTVNFTTALSSANYCVTTAGAPINNSGAENVSLAIKFGTTPTAAAVQVYSKTVGLGATDTTFGCVAVFR